MEIYHFLLLLLLRHNLAQTNFKYKYKISNSQNFESSHYQNSFEYKNDFSDDRKLKSDSHNNRNSYFTKQISDTDHANHKDYGLVPQPQRSLNNRPSKSFWSSENDLSSSPSLSSKIDNNFKRFTSESKTQPNLLESSSIHAISSNSRKDNSWTTISPMIKSITTSKPSITKDSEKYDTTFKNGNNISNGRYSKSFGATSLKNSITKKPFVRIPTTKNSDRSSRNKTKRICERKYEEFLRKIFGDSEDIEEINLRNVKFNGREIADPGEYPHMTAIGYRRHDNSIDWKCGGSLIDEYFVITAAHCTDFSGQKPSEVKIGDINLKVREKSIQPQRISIKDIYNHPKYNKSSNYNDIALLRLKKRISFTQFVRPIRLYIKNNIPYDTVYAMGYGATAFGKTKTNILTDLNLTIVQNDECNQILPKDSKTPKGIIDSQVCAIDKDGNRDTCQGDSGGPLQLNLLGSKRIQYHLIGITSYGFFCGSQKPSVYTRISSFIDWIEKTVWLDN